MSMTTKTGAVRPPGPVRGPTPTMGPAGVRTVTKLAASTEPVASSRTPFLQKIPQCLPFLVAQAAILILVEFLQHPLTHIAATCRPVPLPPLGLIAS